MRVQHNRATFRRWGFTLSLHSRSLAVDVGTHHWWVDW